MTCRNLSIAIAFALIGCGGSSETGTGGSGGGGSGGAGGSATGGAGGSGGSGATGGSATGGNGGGNCSACGVGLQCCGGVLCVNPNNDINHCGTCFNKCPGDHPFCDNGTCSTAPCDSTMACGGTSFCCGSQCCNAGDLCCVVPAGPVGPPQCTAPTTDGTCPPGCPSCVCNSPDTPIATPSGERRISEIHEGDSVLSVDHGAVRAVRVRATSRIPAANHQVVELELITGVILHISPKHPTADGRTFGSLRAGDFVDGVRISSAKLVPYTHEATYDILPSSDSGAYFAGGVLIGSTLSPPNAIVSSASAPASRF